MTRGIDRDPLELVRHVESECQAWFDANEVAQTVVQDKNTVGSKVISVEPKFYTKYLIVIGVDLGKINDVGNDIFRTQRC